MDSGPNLEPNRDINLMGPGLFNLPRHVAEPSCAACTTGLVEVSQRPAIDSEADMRAASVRAAPIERVQEAPRLPAAASTGMPVSAVSKNPNDVVGPPPGWERR